MAAPRPQRLISVGSIIADIRVRAPYLPARGGDVITSAATLAAGGGFNVLAAAARQGLPTLFTGRHGCGPYGECIRSALAREGIATLLRADDAGDSGFCLVLVEPDGERTFITSPGIEAGLGSRDLREMSLRGGDAIFVSGYDLCYRELGAAIAGWSATLPLDVVLAVDPGPLIAEIPADVLDRVLSRTDLFTLNWREARILTGAAEVGEIVGRIRRRLKSDAILAIRNGAEGCFLAGADLPSPFAHVPAPRVAAVDTTGAGDTHTGVLIACMGSSPDLLSAARRANAAAALSITRDGPATAPDRLELDAFLAAQPFPDRRKVNAESR